LKMYSERNARSFAPGVGERIQIEIWNPRHLDEYLTLKP